MTTTKARAEKAHFERQDWSDFEKGYRQGVRWIPWVLQNFPEIELLSFIGETHRQTTSVPRDRGFMAGHVAILVGIHLGGKCD